MEIIQTILRNLSFFFFCNSYFLMSFAFVFCFFFQIFWGHFYFLFFTYFNWKIITLKYCDGFVLHKHELAIGMHMHPSS